MMENPPHLSEATLSPSATFPSTYWLSYTNPSPGWDYIVVPSGGNLWVYYGFAQPAKQIYVWHQGGSTTPINPGENNIQVGPGDMIVYQLSNPGSDSIKLGYQIT
jgi:hypothetical protein